MDQPENNSSLLAAAPPLGWNSWNMLGSRVSASAVCGIADAIVLTGLKDCGYTYMVIDDCWSVKDHRDSHGDLIPDPERFPDGIKAVADHVHNRGLKFGIYSDAADRTCGGYPGSYTFEEQDASLWASWGVDFLKYDYCNAPPEQAAAIERYTRMGQALRGCEREVLFSLCEWGGRSPFLWGRKAGGHAWRVTGDVIDSWVNVLLGNWWGLGIDSVLDLAVNLHPYAGPGGWNDMDMLVVGLGGKGNVPGSGASFLEYQTQFSMWSMLCSPLMIGCDVRTLTPEIAGLLMNREVLAVNQDALGKQAVRLSKNGSLEVWRKPLADGSLALALLNRGSTGAEIQFTAGEIGLLDGTRGVIRDLWKQADVADFRPSFAYEVLPHATQLLKISMH
jgi:alpha-galactosidase